MNEDGNANQQAYPDQKNGPIFNIVRTPGNDLVKRGGIVVFNILESIVVSCSSHDIMIDEDIFRSQRYVGRGMDQIVVDAQKPLVPLFTPVNIESGRVEFACSFPGNLNRRPVCQLADGNTDSQYEPDKAQDE